MQRYAAIILILGFGVLLAGSAAAPEGAATDAEIKLKTAILYRVARFVQWPDDAFADADAPIVFGLVGDDAFAAYFDRVVAGKKVHGRPITVRRLRSPPPDADADPVDRDADERAFRDRLHACQLLFVSRDEQKACARIILHVDARPILTVSEIRDFAVDNGMVQLSLNKDQRFDLHVNRAMLERARLAHAGLLDLANIVTSRAPPPERAIPGKEQAARQP